MTKELEELKRCVIIHYAEIGLKGSNRAMFERLLAKNIGNKLGKLMQSCVRESGQLKATLSPSTESDIEKAREILRAIPGIAHYSFAAECSKDPDRLKSETVSLLREKDKSSPFTTFKINASRSDKSYKLNSMQLNADLGEAVINALGKKALMKNPEVEVKVEVGHKNIYVSLEEIEGFGGMPTDSKQKVVALLSGGFDSPVAAALMMKRGCEVILAHFHNKNQEEASVEDKIVRIAEKLSEYQQHTRLFIVPFEDAQKEIIMNVKSEKRMLVYRRLMLRIASEIMKSEKGSFLVVGDSLSQVASQTFENLSATYTIENETGAHIFSPLIGMDKKDIISISRKIGTFDLSKLAYGDCCSYFIPKHPELRARAEELEREEKGLDIKGLIEGAIRKARVKEF